jgi:2-hydroxychromene-2-carboxylate isomerase
VGIREGWGEAFVAAAYRLWFTENLSNGTEENLAKSLQEIGQNQVRVVKEAQRDEIGQEFESATDVAKHLGIFGTPTFVVGDQLF